MDRPTEQFYTWLTAVFDHFNQALFAGELAPVMLTVQRQKNTMGYFSPSRWKHRAGRTSHEIAVNPAYFANHTLLELCQTVVHEQCHLWQHESGNPSRTGYHNQEWADKMESVGLIPSDTGRPGGKRVGQRMSDYPAPDGPFIQAAKDLPTKGLELEWVDVQPAPKEPCSDRENEPPTPELGAVLADLMPGLVRDMSTVDGSKKKTRYVCADCDAKVWGKPTLKIRCGCKPDGPMFEVA